MARKHEIMTAIMFEATYEDPVHPLWEALARDPEDNVPTCALFKGHKHWDNWKKEPRKPDMDQIKKYIREVKSKPFGRHL